MVLIYISLTDNDVEHLFMCLLFICMSSLEKYILCPFLVGLFCPFIIELQESSNILDASPSSDLVYFHFLMVSIEARVFNLIKCKVICFFFCCLCF